MPDFPDSGIYRCSHGAVTRSSAQKGKLIEGRSGSCSANALAKRRLISTSILYEKASERSLLGKNRFTSSQLAFFYVPGYLYSSFKVLQRQLLELLLSLRLQRQQRDIEKREHKSSESFNKAYWKRLEEQGDWGTFFVRDAQLKPTSISSGGRSAEVVQLGIPFDMRYSYGDFSPFLPCLHSRLALHKKATSGPFIDLTFNSFIKSFLRSGHVIDSSRRYATSIRYGSTLLAAMDSPGSLAWNYISTLVRRAGVYVPRFAPSFLCQAWRKLQGLTRSTTLIHRHWGYSLERKVLGLDSPTPKQKNLDQNRNFVRFSSSWNGVSSRRSSCTACVAYAKRTSKGLRQKPHSCIFFLLGTRSERMHWIDARALRRKDAFRGKRPWGDTVYDPWISDRETVSKLRS
ncbi:hypothetical protein VNO78_24323 [Psophocarpus tetragonolobus]|uniref:Uncharacterized protein n=1 Tax=Psophocarpus tetragonolobus TaxID=3891 RepID=A0AAN9S505_PSOTE